MPAPPAGSASHVDIAKQAILEKVEAERWRLDALGSRRVGGYSEDEHAPGVALRRTAAGEARSLEVLFQSVRSAPENASLAVLQQIDELENGWVPRTRSIIEHVVSDVTRSERTATQFADAFFQNLAQQPIGPGVVASVSTYLRRVEALGKSRAAGAREVLQTLRARGLDEARLRSTQQLVESAEGSRRRPAEIDAPELASARAQQMESLGSLRRWFAGWSTYAPHQLQRARARSSGSAPQRPGAPDATRTSRRSRARPSRHRPPAPDQAGPAHAPAEVAAPACAPPSEGSSAAAAG